MKRPVSILVTEIITMLEQVAGSEDPATSAQERVVARGYLAAFTHALARSRRSGARLTRPAVHRFIMIGFNMFNPTMEEFSERRQSEGKSFVKDTMEKLDIAERLRDAALDILERNS